MISRTLISRNYQKPLNKFFFKQLIYPLKLLKTGLVNPVGRRIRRKHFVGWVIAGNGNSESLHTAFCCTPGRILNRFANENREIKNIRKNLQPEIVAGKPAGCHDLPDIRLFKKRLADSP